MPHNGTKTYFKTEHDKSYKAQPSFLLTVTDTNLVIDMVNLTLNA